MIALYCSGLELILQYFQGMLYIHVHSSIIHNTQRVGAIQRSINRRMSEQNMIYNILDYYSDFKRKEILTCAATRKNLADIMLKGEINHTKNDDYLMIPLTRGT